MRPPCCHFLLLISYKRNPVLFNLQDKQTVSSSVFVIGLFVMVTEGTLPVAQLVKALRYKPEGRGFDSRWCHSEIFIDIILPPSLIALGSTQRLTEISTRNISWGVKAAGAQGWQPYHLHVLAVLKSGRLNLLEPSGPDQACNGIALHLPYYCGYIFP